MRIDFEDFLTRKQVEEVEQILEEVRSDGIAVSDVVALNRLTVMLEADKERLRKRGVNYKHLASAISLWAAQEGRWK